MKLTVEYAITGPLAHKRTRHALEAAVAAAGTLDEVDRAVSDIKLLATYRGGSHVAVHPSGSNGVFEHGSGRLAIITEG